MRIGPKYKIARRLGAPIFEKTQTQKFALSEEKKSRRGGRPKTDFGLQLTEKQKARFFYGVSEKQFKNYVKEALSKKGVIPASELLSLLESRLDNVVWRLGFAPTHGAARQMVSHGHITVNARKSRVPSCRVNVDDEIGLREGSKTSPLFASILEKGIERELLPWLSYDDKKKTATVKGKPVAPENALMFDLGQVIEFYQR
ncbi:MAG TPA: 30S ribosomal protein S4 [Candidatus Paceibacterota bacterium]